MANCDRYWKWKLKGSEIELKLWCRACSKYPITCWTRNQLAFMMWLSVSVLLISAVNHQIHSSFSRWIDDNSKIDILPYIVSISVDIFIIYLCVFQRIKTTLFCSMTNAQKCKTWNETINYEINEYGIRERRYGKCDFFQYQSPVNA